MRTPLGEASKQESQDNQLSASFVGGCWSEWVPVNITHHWRPWLHCQWLLLVSVLSDGTHTSSPDHCSLPCPVIPDMCLSYNADRDELPQVLPPFWLLKLLSLTPNYQWAAHSTLKYMYQRKTRGQGKANGIHHDQVTDQQWWNQHNHMYSKWAGGSIRRGECCVYSLLVTPTSHPPATH